MVPGLRIFGFGRYPGLEGGGTDMRTASSVLFNVSGLPPEASRVEEARIAQRFWFYTTRRVVVGPLRAMMLSRSRRRLTHYLQDSRRAASALRAAPATGVDVLRAGCPVGDGGANVAVTHGVAEADDHVRLSASPRVA